MKIKETWTYNHKLLIVTLSLIVAHVVPLIELPSIAKADTVYYQAYDLQSHLDKRAKELYTENQQIDLERYRLQAIRETNLLLIELSTTSPYISYEELKAKYGY